MLETEADAMIKTKKWDDRREADDGFCLLICRYRPRALPKKKETWDLWWPHLGPSKELHAAFYGKSGPAISWEEYERRYREEMGGEEEQESIAVLAEKVAEGKAITLLCSSMCDDPSRCHRTLLKEMIEKQAAKLGKAKSS